MNLTSTAQPRAQQRTLARTRARHAFPAAIFPAALALPALALFFAMAGSARAQDFAPGIGFVYPAGGQQGASFRVTVGGQHLAQPSGAVVSGAGVRAIVIPTEPLLNPRQANETRDKIRELRQQRNPALRGEIEKLSRKLAASERARIIPAIGARVTLEVTIAPDAPPGNRELRLLTAVGLTNPLVFQVGTLPECSEPEAKEEENPARLRRLRGDPDSRASPDRDKAPPTPVTFPTTINGRILPGETDRFQFTARRGQRLLAAVSARELLPYLADTVPGWMQATLTLLAPDGKEIAPLDDIQIHADPAHRYEIPADGEYTLEIRDNIYRGRDDFVYRIRLGDPEKVAGASNSRRREQDAPPTLKEREPNNTPETAQPVTLPALIAGRIDEPGDIDVFRFEGDAGGQIVAEVHARRLGSPLDSFLIITDAAGNKIGFNDDHEDKGSGLNTHHADSYLAVTLPATGAYFVHIGDIQQNGGEAFTYRLRIGPPRPDFALRVTPSTINLRANATQPLTVHALRRDGFDGEIALALRNAPAGFRLSGAKIPAGQDKIQLTLTAPPTFVPAGRLMLEGRATINGQPRVRPAVPAREMTQAFAYQHLVPGDDLLVHVSRKFALNSPAELPGSTPVKIAPGGTARVKFNIPNIPPMETDKIQLLDPPEGISLKKFSVDAGRVTLVLEADAAKAKPGQTGNIIAVFVAKNRTAPEYQRAGFARVPLGALPAIPFEITGGNKR